jgi:uncharacterized coiled-coil DUF342 family protein
MALLKEQESWQQQLNAMQAAADVARQRAEEAAEHASEVQKQADKANGEVWKVYNKQVELFKVIEVKQGRKRQLENTAAVPSLAAQFSVSHRSPSKSYEFL